MGRGLQSGEVCTQERAEDGRVGKRGEDCTEEEQEQRPYDKGARVERRIPRGGGLDSPQE